MTKVLLLNQQRRDSELINQFGAELIIWRRQRGNWVMKKTYEEIRITEKDQAELVERSNKLFSNLRR